jgi:hypothetical protein
VRLVGYVVLVLAGLRAAAAADALSDVDAHSVDALGVFAGFRLHPAKLGNPDDAQRDRHAEAGLERLPQEVPAIHPRVCRGVIPIRSGCGVLHQSASG